jgi:hypothetical protein
MAQQYQRESKLGFFNSVVLIVFLFVVPVLFPYWSMRQGLISREQSTLLYGIGAILCCVFLFAITYNDA